MSAKNISYSVEKCPASYDEYEFTLPELYRQIAKEELREDDVIREQSLAEMRQWIANNPHIRKCRTDAKFLLRFLRATKFTVPMACEALEHFLTMRELYPSWFKNLDCNDFEMRLLWETIGTYVLGQDSAGRTVVLVQAVKVEAGSITPPLAGRFLMLLLDILLASEEVQIGGILLLLDYSGISLKLFEGWGATEYRISFDGLARFYPVRYHAIHAAKLPNIAVSIMEHLLSFAPPKLREKIHCHATVEELEKLMEPSMTPQDYGGTVDLDQLNKNFWERVEQQHEEFALGLDKFEIDVDHYTAVWDKMNPDMMEAKAFKKLNID